MRPHVASGSSAVLLLLLAGCTTGGRAVVSADTGRPLERRCDVDTGPSPYQGRTVAEVEALLPADGFTQVRVVCADGRELDRTSDRRPERLDVTLEDGRVLSVRD